MKKYLDANPYSTASQMTFMLLGAMDSLGKGGHTKANAIEQIQRLKWFDIQPEDREPYPSDTIVGKEPRWHKLIAFRRKDCYEEELFVRDSIRNSWQISKDGQNAYVHRKREFLSGSLNCAECYVWSDTFKRLIQPDYVKSNLDAIRPIDIYRDKTSTKLAEKLIRGDLS